MTYPYYNTSQLFTEAIYLAGGATQRWTIVLVHTTQVEQLAPKSFYYN